MSRLRSRGRSRGGLFARPTALAAVIVVATAFAACSKDPEAQKQRFMASGDRYVSEGKFREAVIDYKNAVQADPVSGQARAKLAAAYEKIGDGSSALSEYVRAADLLPDDVGLQLTAGNYLLAARRVDEALARAEAVIKVQPNNLEAHVLRGNALGGLNDLDRALAAMEEALRLDPTRGATYTQLGLVETARGRQAEAEVAFKKAVSLAPDWIGGHLALANFYWSAGRLPDAERALGAALKVDPKNVNANHAMAVFSLSTGRVGEAETYLKQVSEVTQTPTSLFTLAEYYIATGRPPEAISILTPMATDARTAAAAKQRLVKAYAASGSNAKAHSLIDEILAQTPRDAQVQLLKGQLLLDENRRDEALESVKAAVAAEPMSVAALFTLGRVYAARGDVTGAEAAFREVLRLNPSASAAQVELSLLQLSSGTVASALRSAEDAVKSQPGRVEARLALIRSLLAAKEFTRAQQEIQLLLEKRPELAAAHVQAGVLAASRGNVSAARTAFQKGLQLEPGSLEAIGGLVALELNTKNFKAAQELIGRQLESGPVTSGLLLLAARTYGSANDLTSAERVLRRAIDADPTLLPAYSMLGQIYLSQGKLDEARQEFDNLAKRHSNPVGALTMAGMILQAQQNAPEARLRFERAVALDPNAAVAANNLAWIYAESGQKLEDALRFARAAAEALPNAPEVLDTLGWVYYKSDMPGLAIAPLIRSIEKAPKNADYRYHLALAYAKSGDQVRGREAFTQALALAPTARWANDARRALATLGEKGSR
jgi:cellulose synthase operon protein C